MEDVVLIIFRYRCY